MVLNYVWIAFFIIAFVVAVFRFTGYYFADFFTQFNIIFDKTDLTVFNTMLDSTFKMAGTSVTIAIYLIGVMTFWLGMLKVGEKGGAVNVMMGGVKPLFKKLFPSIPENHPAMGNMMMNICATMLGLESAATPMGLKAMNELQEVNETKDTASNAQIMYFIMVVTGFMLLPVNIIALRAASGAVNPADILIPLVITTFVAAFSGVLIVALIQKINLFNKVVLSYLLFFILFFGGLLYFISHLSPSQSQAFGRMAGSFLIIGVIVFFILLAWIKKVNVFEVFIEGAKEGFTIAIKLIPYLVAMLVAIGVFRASGAMDLLIAGIVKLFGWMGISTDFAGALPVALMKPLSGNGARGLMVEAMNHYGADSYTGRLASLFQGATDTTFYVLALYFGSVSIKKTRYALGVALIADLIGIIAAIIAVNIFF
jgi:spore maturation protein SpmA